MSEPIHIISLGAGVQSSTMALMAAKGAMNKQCWQFARPRPALVVYRAFDPLDGRILTEARMRYERRRAASCFYTRYIRHHKRAAEKTWPDVLETRQAVVTVELLWQ